MLSPRRWNVAAQVVWELQNWSHMHVSSLMVLPPVCGGTQKKKKYYSRPGYNHTSGLRFNRLRLRPWLFVLAQKTLTHLVITKKLKWMIYVTKQRVGFFMDKAVVFSGMFVQLWKLSVNENTLPRLYKAVHMCVHVHACARMCVCGVLYCIRFWLYVVVCRILKDTETSFASPHLPHPPPLPFHFFRVCPLACFSSAH